MSGQTPRHAFTVPKPPAEECHIAVPREAIDALRNTIPVSRDDAMRWVDPSRTCVQGGQFSVLWQQ